MSGISGGTDNRSLRELKDEVKDLNTTLKKAIKTGDRFSVLFVTFALIQIMIGLYDFVYSVQTGEGSRWAGLFWVGLVLITVLMILKGFGLMDKNKDQNK